MKNRSKGRPCWCAASWWGIPLGVLAGSMAACTYDYAAFDVAPEQSDGGAPGSAAPSTNDSSATETSTQGTEGALDDEDLGE